jgi:hypothetical protein
MSPSRPHCLPLRGKGVGGGVPARSALDAIDGHRHVQQLRRRDAASPVPSRSPRDTSTPTRQLGCQL